MPVNLGVDRSAIGRGKRDFTFHHSQRDLGELDIIAPISIKQEKIS